MKFGSDKDTLGLIGVPYGSLGARNRGRIEERPESALNGVQMQRAPRTAEKPRLTAVITCSSRYSYGTKGSSDSREVAQNLLSDRYQIVRERRHPGFVNQESYGDFGKNRGGATVAARLCGPIQFVRNLLATWKLDMEAAAALLGLEAGDRPYAQDLVAGRRALRGRDAKDRIVHLYHIRKMLSAMFRDEAVENEWLREPHTMLAERAPMDLMLEGSMEICFLSKSMLRRLVDISELEANNARDCGEACIRNSVHNATLTFNATSR